MNVCESKSEIEIVSEFRRSKREREKEKKKGREGVRISCNVPASRTSSLQQRMP